MTTAVEEMRNLIERMWAFNESLHQKVDGKVLYLFTHRTRLIHAEAQATLKQFIDLQQEFERLVRESELYPKQ